MRIRRYRGRHLRPQPKKTGPVVLATAATMSMATPALAGTHVVRKGQTLSGIAARYGTSVSSLARMNDLSNPDLIVAGQRLRVPGGGGGGGGATHTVRAGDTLSSIAARHGTTVAALAGRNRIGDPNLIVVGQKLRVPSGRATGGSARVSGSAGSPSGDWVGAALHGQAVAHGLEPALVKAVAWQESGWRQAARSSVGAIGIMQVMPATADFVNQVLGHGRLNVRRGGHNVHLGVAYLRHMWRTMGSTRRALAAYYSGPGNVRGKLNSGQRGYVRSVLALRDRFR